MKQAPENYARSRAGGKSVAGTTVIPAASLAALLAFAFFAASSRAQGGWASKPFEEWTKADAERVLNDSPWVKKQTIKLRPPAQRTRVAGGPNPVLDGVPIPVQTEGNTAALGGARAPVDYTFTLRLRSALPVRQALARLMQLDKQAAKLGDKERKTHEARVKGTLECPACADNYVLALSSRSQESPNDDPVYALFNGAQPETFKRYVYLADERGERRALVHLVPPRAPGEEATLFFPRLDESGRPLLTPDSKKLVFNLTNNEVSLVANFTLDVAGLVSGGKVLF